MLETEIKTIVEYYDQNFTIILKIIQKGGHQLKSQMFSQKMMENHISDLLDLAKIENNSFNISSEYFDIGALIHESIQMMAHKAHDSKVALSAEIDERNNLYLLENIYGDQRRFL